jgi:hypothetical protein
MANHSRRIQGVLAEQQTILDGLIGTGRPGGQGRCRQREQRFAPGRNPAVPGRNLEQGAGKRRCLSSSHYREINNRSEQIGPPPGKDGPPESDRVAKERQALTAEKAEINVALGRAEDLSVRINGLINKISTLRDLFTNLLTKRYELTDAIGKQ